MISSESRIREIRTSGLMSGGEETWLRTRLRHWHHAKAARNSNSLGPTAGRASPRLYTVAYSAGRSRHRYRCSAGRDARRLEMLDEINGALWENAASQAELKERISPMATTDGSYSRIGHRCFVACYETASTTVACYVGVCSVRLRPGLGAFVARWTTG